MLKAFGWGSGGGICKWGLGAQQRDVCEGGLGGVIALFLFTKGSLCTWAFSQPGFLSSPIDPAADSLMGKHGSAPRTAVLLMAKWKETCQTSLDICRTTLDIHSVREKAYGAGRSTENPPNTHTHTLILLLSLFEWVGGGVLSMGWGM
jgi:hypothetical protein